MGRKDAVERLSINQQLDFVQNNEEQLSVVQRNFPEDVVQNVIPPELAGMSRRRREKALSEYRNELKVCQLKFMNFDEEAVRHALKETYRKDIRADQHVSDAA